MSEQQTDKKAVQGREVRPGRLLRWIWRILASVFAVLLIALSALTALLSTHQGSHWMLARIISLLNNTDQQLSYASADGTFMQGLNLNSVQWQNGDNQVHIEQLHSRWNPMTILDGEFHLESLRIAGLQLDWTSAPPPAEPPPALVLDDLLDAVLPLPINIRLSNARLDGATVHMDGQEFLLNVLTLDAALTGRRLQINQIMVDTDPVDVQGSAELHLVQPYAITSTLHWHYVDSVLENTSPPAGTLSIGGDLDLLQIEHEFRGPAAVYTQGQVSLDLAHFLNAETDAMELQLDLEHELQAMPVPGADQLVINALNLRTQGSPQDLGLFAAAHITATPTADIVLDTDLNLRAYLRGSQLNLDELALRTPEGLLALTGNVDWSNGLIASIDYELDDPAPGSYVGNLPDGLDIRDLTSLGELRVQRATEANAPLQISFTTPRVSARINDYQLNASTAVTYDGERWQVESLALQSGANRVNANAQLDADNNLQVSLDVNAPELQTLYPSLQGTLTGHTEITGTLENPVIDIDLAGNALQFNEIRIPELTVRGQNRAGMNELEMRANNITAPVAENTETINSIMLRLRGQPDAHNLLVRVDSDYARVRINADGGVVEGGWRGRLLSSELESDYGTWQQDQAAALAFVNGSTSIDTLCWQMLNTRLCGDASLDSNNQLNASLSLLEFPLTVFNLLTSEQTIARELDLNFHAGNPQRENIRMPVSLPADMAVRGELTVLASASGPLDSIADMQIAVEVRSDDGRFYIRGDAPPADPAVETDGLVPTALINEFVWPMLQISANQNGGLWQGLGQIGFYQEDPENPAAPMRGSAETRIQMDRSQQLQGELRLTFDDLGWLEGIVPQISEVSGQLAGQLDIGGSLQQPRLAGNISLTDAALNVPALGLNLDAIETTLDSDGIDRFLLSGYARSGEGSVNFSSEINDAFNNNRRVEMHLAGENFVLATLPELQLSITPDLHLQGSNQGISLSGQIHVPRLIAEVNTLPETAVDVSSDTVIIQAAGSADIRNAALAEPTALAGIPLSGDVRLELGNDVRVSGFGLNVQVRGQLDINQRPNATPLTYGELEVVNGSFATYGRTLNIEQGKLMFMGSYDNPAIDIRAARTVENMRVGVQMNGTVRNINSSLFSTPTMPDGDILSVMITGRPIAEIGTQQDGNALIGALTTLGINQSQGITNQIQNQLGLDALSINSTGDVKDSSLMLGKYITPRIFVRYAVGLFETENSLAIDYTMTERIKLKATSGSTQAIDVTYTVEK